MFCLLSETKYDNDIRQHVIMKIYKLLRNPKNKRKRKVILFSIFVVAELRLYEGLQSKDLLHILKTQGGREKREKERTRDDT